MNVIILGWYGTETLGDRGILLGIINILYKAFGATNISIGSIYPFFTERTLFEDNDFIRLCSMDLKTKYFDVRDAKVLANEIKNSDLVIMGGGPIMDLYELGIVEYGFKIAKRYNKKTALLGCGVGPLFDKRFQKMTLKIMDLSDLIILRDEVSKKNVHELERLHNVNIKKEIFVTFDPAILPIKIFLEKYKREKNQKNYIAVNFREFPSESFKDVDSKEVNKLLLNQINNLSEFYQEVLLFPMHTFSVGGDDRYFLSKLKQKKINGDFTIVNKPMSLWGLFSMLYEASACIGMRYHSVIFQTLLNGNNLIYDYTEPNKGKISGFLDMIGGNEFYVNKYINLQSLSGVETLDLNLLRDNEPFIYSTSIFTECEELFINKLREIF